MRGNKSIRKKQSFLNVTGFCRVLVDKRFEFCFSQAVRLSKMNPLMLFEVGRIVDKRGATVDRIIPIGVEVDYGLFLTQIQPAIVGLLTRQLEVERGLKFHFKLDMTFKKINDPSVTQDWFAVAEAKLLLPADNVVAVVMTMCNQLVGRIENYTVRGSGWTVDKITFLDIYTNRYRPLRGDNFIPTPKKLADKKAIINVKNSDQKCFLWSVLAKLHPAKKNQNCLYHYRRFANQLDLTDIQFPMTIESIDRFESNNNLAINVFGYENQLYPIRSTRLRDDPHSVINLLLLTRGRRRHYCLIKNLNRLLHDQTNHNGRKFYCVFCLMHFGTEALLDRHVVQCQTGEVRIEMPEETTMKFSKYKNQLWASKIVVADFESFLKPIDRCSPDPRRSSTTKTAEHEANSFAAVTIDYCGCADVAADYTDLFLYRGEKPAEQFLRHLLRVGEHYQQQINSARPIQMTTNDNNSYNSAVLCHICGQAMLVVDKCKDHCHICGKFRGAAHNRCNLAYQNQRDLTVVLHCSRRYDTHLIMKDLGQFANEHNFPIWCVAKSTEDYLSFGIRARSFRANGSKFSWNIRFIDSYQFLTASLDSLVTALLDHGENQFAAMHKYFPNDEQRRLLLCKNPYPYEWVTGWDKFDVESIPPASAFYNSLEGSAISADRYAHAVRMWDLLQCQDFGDYSDTYLRCDTLQLADVFQNFRRTCHEYYRLDPAHYISLPSFAWDACLRHTGVTLELLQSPEDYQFYEDGIKGGISVVSGRYAQANNPLMGDLYDPNLPNSHILYLDANNLYGWSMSRSLPIGDFRYLSDDEIDRIDEAFVLATDENAPKGHVYEVNLKVPQNLHDLFSDYPLAPESLEITDRLISPYSRMLKERFNHSSTPMVKLTPNLFNKTNYIVHEQNLKFYIQKGLQLTKVHRVMEFTQSKWLSAYISFNTMRRAESTNKFQKDFFKLMNNAVFGKSMENVRKYQNIRLITRQSQLDKLVAKPNYRSNVRFNDDLIAVSMAPQSIKLCKPVYSGFTILDVSKLVTYKFHYDHIVPTYGTDATLLFTDTDSLCYHIQTDDVYRDMLSVRDIWFDCSCYKQNNPLYSDTNKMAIGYFKNEFPDDKMLIQFVGLRAKMYSCKGLGDTGKRVGKGITKATIRNQLRHEDYLRALEGEDEQRAVMRRFQSDKHVLFTVEQVKTTLSCYDDKRYILPCGQKTLAYGHYRIAEQ